VIFRVVAESGSRLLSVVQPVASPGRGIPAVGPLAEPGLAEVVTLQRRKAAEIDGSGEESFFLDTLAECQRARDAAGLAATTLDRLTRPVLEICGHCGLAPWRLTPRQVDKYFAGGGQTRPVHGPAEDEHHRQLLRLPRAAVRR
jgi:integrase/recombinase XerC